MYKHFKIKDKWSTSKKKRARHKNKMSQSVYAEFHKKCNAWFDKMENNDFSTPNGFEVLEFARVWKDYAKNYCDL